MASILKRLRPNRSVLGVLMDVQRGSPNIAGSKRERENFAQTYAEKVSRIAQIHEVRVRDNVSYLDIHTVYEGDIRAIEDKVYEIEASMMEKFPNVRADWHLDRLRSPGGNAVEDGTPNAHPVG